MAFEGWTAPNLDEATLRWMRHFRILREYLYQQKGYSQNFSSDSSVNTEEYTIVYLQYGDVYKVSDTSIEQIVNRMQQLNPY